MKSYESPSEMYPRFIYIGLSYYLISRVKFMLNKPILNTFKFPSVVKTFLETSLMRFRN